MHRLPHGGDALGATPGHPLLTPALSGARDLSMSRQQALLDLAAIQRIPGLAGYWPADPAYLFEDSAGTIPASVNGVVGCVRNVLEAPVYTPVAIANPGFDADSDWTKGTGWTIADGVATKAAGTASVLSQAVSLVAGVDYVLTWTMTRSAGTLTPRFTGGTTNTGTGMALSGTYEENFVATTGNATLEFSADASFAGTVDNVTLVSVSNAPALQATTAVKPYLRRTPTSGVYWLDSNTSTSALTVALSNTVLGRRNLLTYSEAFDNVTAWPHATTIAGTGLAPIRTANAGVDPLGGSNATRLQFSLNGGTTTSDISGISQAITSVTGTYVQSFYLKSYDANNYTISLVDGAGGYENITVTPTWQRFSRSVNGTWQYSRLRLRGAQGTSGTADILAFGAQVESGTVATDYQRTVTGAAYCTVARASAVGATITENSDIAPSYNIAPYNASELVRYTGDVAVFNRTLTETEKALITRFMRRGVPLVVNGSIA